MKDSEQPNRAQNTSVKTPRDSNANQTEPPDGVTRRRLEVINISGGSEIQHTENIVVAFECTECKQMLHIEYSMTSQAESSQTDDGKKCLQCSHPLHLRLPGKIINIWAAG